MKKTRLFGAAAVVVALTLSLGTSWAGDSQTGHYDVSTVVVTGSAAGFNLGGFHFTPGDGAPVSVDIADAVSANVPFQVCQDSNADLQCGTAGEPSVIGCGNSADLTTSAVPFDPEKQVVVFVSTVGLDDAGAPCVGVGTTGDITLNFA